MRTGLHQDGGDLSYTNGNVSSEFNEKGVDAVRKRESGGERDRTSKKRHSLPPQREGERTTLRKATFIIFSFLECAECENIQARREGQRGSDAIWRNSGQPLCLPYKPDIMALCKKPGPDGREK